MSRRSPLMLALGVAGLLVLLAAAWFGGASAMPSYLAAWLLVIAVPLGALPLVMAHDLLARPETSVSAALRQLLAAMPIAALLAIPVLIDLQGLYPAVSHGGFAGTWRSGPFTIARSIAFLLVWVVLAVLFHRTPAPPSALHRRRTLAGLGLALHLAMGTLAAFDWVGGVDPDLNASDLGLLVLVAQSGIALSAAGLIAVRSGGSPPADLAPAMLVLLGAWLFLQFTQYLVVWSANLPGEITWYIRRNDGLGQAAEIAAIAVTALATVLLLWRRTVRILLIAAGLILLMHGVEMFWLIVPASRGRFTLDLPDVAALLGLGGLLGGALLFLRRDLASEGVRHGPA